MLHPSVRLPSMSTCVLTATAVQRRPCGRELVRNLLHLMTVLALMLSTLTPLLSPQAALADVRDAVDWSGAALDATAPAARAPYRAGMAPTDRVPAATGVRSPAAESNTLASQELAPAWFATTADSQDASDAAAYNLSPAWFSAASAAEVSSTSRGLEQVVSGEEAPLFAAG